MQLPFSVEQFLATFRAYNDAIGIAPVFLIALAVALVVIAHSDARWRHRAVVWGLAALWMWSGIVYHWGFFSAVNPAARLFGGVFVVQAILLSIADRAGTRIDFSPRESGSAVIGWALIVYALVVYPILGFASGHGYPDGPSFGAPCPLTIYFFGMMCWTVGRIRLLVVAAPILWAAIGTSAALQLGIREDFGLAVAAVAMLVVLFRRRLHPALLHART